MKFSILVGSLLLAGCSSTQIYDNRPAGMPASAPASGVVQVLYSYPTRPYEVIGVVSAKRYKPGWTDPTVGDAIPQLREAGLKLGADAVVVRSSRSNNDRHTVVEAEAVKYLDQQPGQLAQPQQQGQMQYRPPGTTRP
jgi:hypothetical protein